jgi:hypothetical protein
MYNAFMASQVSDNFASSDIIQLLVVFVQCCYVIGMRILAIKLMDPFGDDLLEGLSAMTFIRTGLETSNTILNAKFPDDTEEYTSKESQARAEGSKGNEQDSSEAQLLQENLAIIVASSE